MDVSDAMRLRQLEYENVRLRKMVTERALAISIPQGCPVEKLLKPASCKKAVRYVQTSYTASQRRPCATLGVNRSSVWRPPPQDLDAELPRRLRELAGERRRFGV